MENEQKPEEQKELSKKALKKLEKEKEKEAKKKENQDKQKAQQQQSAANDQSVDLYGEYVYDDQKYTDRKWLKLIDLNEGMEGQEVLVRTRIHGSRASGNMVFLELRDQFTTIQCLASKSDKISKQMIKFIGSLSCESIVDVHATVNKVKEEIKSCSIKTIELSINKIYCVSRSKAILPFGIVDASRQISRAEELAEFENKKEETKEEEKKEEQSQPKVNMKTRLDNRIIDLRTPAKQAIFRIQAAVCLLFREFLLKEDFMEIHTPKMLGGSSEGGANVFKFKYFGKEGCLAQSPQLFKQMALMADCDRVFEIAPVFRAEDSNTPRHLCEFTGLDMEMTIKENYMELLDCMSDLFIYIFKNMKERYSKEIEAIREQFPFDDLEFCEPALKLTFKEGCQMLKEAGWNQDPTEDLDTANEKKLGDLVKEKYHTDFYMLHQYPKSARPFYTMLNKDDPEYTNSYDFFIRGQEITSGAQRIHDVETIKKRAEEKGIPVNTIIDYCESFSYGAFPHGGCGIGLERVVFLYCNLYNVRNASMFPRDPKRIAP